MKTLCLTLLLLSVLCCCCDALSEGLRYSTNPERCCFNFQTRPFPGRVASVVKTHGSCLKKAFIVQTVRGREICYRQTFQWAMDVYNKMTN